MDAAMRPVPASILRRVAATLMEPASFWMLWLALLVPLLALYLPVSIWTGNEENYFQLAYRRIAPEAFSPWSAVFDHSNARVAGESLYGGLVKLLGYETAHVVARLGAAALYAAGLTAMFAAVRFSIIESVAVVMGFHLLGQQILGDEWLFGGAEPKTVAYALIFFSVALASSNRWRAAFAVAAGATWFHFLAGGFWSLALGLCAVWQLRRDWRAALRALTIYLLLVSPLLAIIANDQLTTVGTLPVPDTGEATVPNVDQIYASRSAHHASPFVDPAHFPHWRRGIKMLGLAIVAFVFVWWRRPASRLLLPLAGIGLAELALALVVSYFDQERFTLAKFYLFRPSSVTLLLLLGAALMAFRSVVPRRFSAVVTVALVLVALRGLQLELQDDRRALGRSMNVPHQSELLDAVWGSSAPDDVVLLDPALDQTLPGIRLNRLIERPTVVARKFVPTAPPDIRRWYTLMRWRERLFEEGCNRGTGSVPVKLIVTFSQSTRERVAGCGTVIWRRDDLSVLRVER
jgi:hypothetical protein